MHQALCFTKADLPLLRTVEMRGRLLLYRKALAKRLVTPGPLTADSDGELVARLSGSLRPAWTRAKRRPPSHR